MRADIDSNRLIYGGLSMGATFAPVLLVEEPRFQAAVLIAGGYWGRAFMAEVEPRRYAPHVKIPVPMINGILDDIHPLEISQMPMFRHLGSTDEQIKHFESVHVPAVDETVRFADEWLRSRPGAG
jgi:predicted peptidase